MVERRGQMREEDLRKLQHDYKSRVFTSIFNEKKEILKLYNALNNSDYTDETQIEVTTIGEGDLYIGMYNDSSFIISEELNLWEHQSTECPNIPMRGFLYMAESYNRYIKEHNLEKQMYTTRLIKFPTPKFIVFYNGIAEKQERYRMRLSDCFVKSGSCIEMNVDAYNINFGKNKELMKKCKTLEDYSVLIHRIRVYNKEEKSKERAVDRAIDECISEHRLEAYLRKNRKEVRGMLLAVPTPEEIAEAQREVDIEDAEARGRAELISRIRKYAEQNNCSLEKAFLEVEAMQKKNIQYKSPKKSTGKAR